MKNTLSIGMGVLACLSKQHNRGIRMKYVISCLLLILTCTSCCRSTGDVWEDTKSAGRYFGKGFCVLAGQDDCYYQNGIRDDFCCYQEEDPFCQFDALEDETAHGRLGMKPVDFPQPREMPGEPGSKLPSLEAFIDPSTYPELAKSFQNVQFAYDNSQVKGEDSIARVRAAANYMKAHPNVYVFVEGHCDERGPEAYNLALGSRRANSVRNMLIAEGVNKDRIFTISYGKERPLVLDHHDEARAINRRAEFKVYKPS
jgi:peptidoglycan-associated lipoprotein